MKLKRGDEVITPYGPGIIRHVAYDIKFDINFYFVDVLKTDRRAQLTGSRYETKKFWDYEVKEI